MKISRILHTTIILLFFSFTVSFGQQAEKTFVKSFNTEGHINVLLDLPGKVEVKTWNNDIVRIQMTVALPHGNDALLTSLVEAGRYNLRSASGAEGLTIYLPGLTKEVSIRGKALEEQFSFIVFAPEKIGVKLVGKAAEAVVGLVD